MGSDKGFFESDDDYEKRISREADERTIEESTGEAPKQGWLEDEDDYRKRISQEAVDRRIENSTGEVPSKGWLEDDDSYRNRTRQEADRRTIEDSTGETPEKGFFESDEKYDIRIRKEANEREIERSTGKQPEKGFFESDRSYRSRIAHEARKTRADSGNADSSADSDTGGGGGGGGSEVWIVLIIVGGLISALAMFSQCSWSSSPSLTVRQDTRTSPSNPQPRFLPRPTPLARTPFRAITLFPVITPIPVIREYQPTPSITAHFYRGKGRIYKVPELKALVGAKLDNSWLYGDFCLSQSDGNILRCHTVGVVLGGPEPGSTKVDIEFQRGVTVSPRIWDLVNHGLVARFRIGQNDPLELISVTKTNAVIVVRCRTPYAYNSGP